MSERGPYLSQNRALNLERELAAVEARLGERIDRQERELAQLRADGVDQLRAMVGALMTELRRRIAGDVAGDVSQQKSDPKT